jgi:small conductance mechanosensitive channel
MTLDSILQTTVAALTTVGLKVLGAIALWVAGRWLIGFAVGILGRALARQNFDATLSRYLQTSLTVLLNVVLVVALLGFFGVETASFAALLAAGGVAIGMAWSGLLANFAAGAFLMFLRPFRVGDLVTAGGVTGVVGEVGLFATTIYTPDNVQTIVGNNKIFSETIQNFSTTPYRRVDLTATISNAVDPREAIRLLQERIATIPHVLVTPALDVQILQFTPMGPLLCVRPSCAPEHYWQVYFETNRAIRETFDAAGFPVPVQPLVVTNAA